MNARIRLTWFFSALLPLSTLAQTAPQSTVLTLSAEDRGFSYFMGVGRSTTTYEETPSIIPVKSHAKVSSPLLITGALYAVSADRLLTLDSEVSFAPGTATERWETDAAVLGSTPITDGLVQTNRFSLQQNTTRVLLHQRVTGPLFAMGGVSFHSLSIRRFGFQAGVDNAVNLPPGTVEETSSEVLVSAGLGLESERVRNSVNHYSLRAAVALPAWRRVQNTSFPDNSFGGTRGHDLTLEARYSQALLPNIHVGLWGQYLASYRRSQVQGNVELPRSELRSLSYGLEFLWKL